MPRTKDKPESNGHLRLSLSSQQYTLLRKMPEKFGVELARRYKQTTFGSFARRGYIRQSGQYFTKTELAYGALAEYQQAEIFRKNESAALSIFLRRVIGAS